MTFPAFPARLLPIARWTGAWRDALLDPARQERTLVWTLIAYTAIWTAYRTIATWPRDLHADETELYDWSRHLAWGNDKHPPLSGWVTRAWLTLFPPSDLAFHLLATVNIALTLYIAWRTMRLVMSAEKSLFGLALLTLVPFFNFIALKYNANAVLLPLWAATIYCFLRAFQARGVVWPVLAGVFAGGAMLGKYWSVVLVGALGLAALLDPRRGRFFLSPAPWLMIVAGAIVIAPHVAWLAAHDFPTFAYAAGHAAQGFAANLLDSLDYIAGCVGYVSVALLVAWLLLRPSRAALGDIGRPSDPQRRMILTIQCLMILLPVPPALATDLRIVPLWTMPGWTLLPVVLLASPLIEVGREALRRAIAIAAIVSLAALAMSPVVALVIQWKSPPGPSEYASLLAEHVEREWRQHSNQPIALVAGDAELAQSTAYYLRTDTRSFAAADVATLKAQAVAGAALVCPAEDADCVSVAEQIAAGGSQILRGRVWLSRPLFGLSGPVVRDVYFLVLPQAPAN